MGKHRTYVLRYSGTNRELGKEIVRMAYDETNNVFKGALEELKKEYKNDSKSRKKKLSKNLNEAIQNLEKVIESIDEAWKICKPRTTKIYRK
ncbi:MAG: hypothetical protein Q8Q41_03340 [bacterium]|nr:hypothetical protein [bacterium]